MTPEYLTPYSENLRDLHCIGKLPQSVIFIPLKSGDCKIGGDVTLSPVGLSSAAAAGRFLSQTLPNGNGVKFSFISCPSITHFAFNAAGATGWSSSWDLFLLLPGKFISGADDITTLGNEEMVEDCTGASAITELFCKAAILDVQPKTIVFFGRQEYCQMMVKALCLMLKISENELFIVRKKSTPREGGC